MVKIYLDMNDGFMHYKIVNESAWNTIQSIFQMNHVKFDGISKSYIVEPSLRAKNLYDELKDYTEVEISEDDLSMLDFATYPPSNELRRIKYSVNKELLEKHPPLKGVEGHENFQLEAMKYVVQRNRCILNISCRSGKSFISIISFGTLLLNNAIDKVFIVCRPEGIVNYKLETLRFLPFIKEDDIVIITKDNRNIEDYFGKKIIITSYNTFRLTSTYYKDLRSKKVKGKKSTMKKARKSYVDFSKFGEKRMIILDECQSINNYDSQQSTCLHLVKDYFERRVEMSGSIGYKFLQMYSLCKFLVPQRIPYSFSEWKNFVSKDQWGRELNEDKVKEFKENVIDELMVTYHNCVPQKEENLELIYVDMNDKMRKIYQEFSSNVVNDLIKEMEGEVTRQSILERLNYLSQITSDPSLLEIKGWKFEDNPKVEILKSLIEKYVDEEGRKVIVWSNHPRVLNKLAEVFSSYNPCVIHGDEKTSVKREERVERINQFKKDPNQKILFTNKVLSTSISLVECSVNIYWDVPSDPDIFEQSRKRVQGPLQQFKIDTNILMFDKSVDLYLYYEILLKRQSMKGLISMKDKLTLDDYKNILNPKREYFIE